MSARRAVLLLLLAVAGCGKVGGLALPEGTPPPNVATDVIVLDAEF